MAKSTNSYLYMSSSTRNSASQIEKMWKETDYKCMICFSMEEKEKKY